MPLDYVTVANLACGFFGEDNQISDKDQDSKAANAVRNAWDLVRLFVLSKTDWTFATRRQRLAARVPNVEWPIINFEFAYPLPSDFVKLVSVFDQQIGEEDFALESGPNGREILLDRRGPLEIRYIWDVEEVARWSPEFIEAFSMRLAWQVADQLSGDKQRKQQALDAFKTAITDARGSDARQKPPRQMVETDWSRGRRGYGLSTRAPGTY